MRVTIRLSLFPEKKFFILSIIRQKRVQILIVLAIYRMKNQIGLLLILLILDI